MTAPAYTHEQLDAMSDRELDAVVAGMVFELIPWEPKRCMHTGAEHHTDKELASNTPYYSTCYGGIGAVVERMRELGFSFGMAGGPKSCVAAQFGRRDIQPAYSEADSLPRAAAIAAVLAVQSVAQ